MYKMCCITKETWGKCGIKTIDYYNFKNGVEESWLKMSDIQKKLNHTKAYELIKKELKGIYGQKKLKYITK